MSSRDTLAANFKKLRAASPGLSRLPDITKAGGGSNGTLGRIASKETGATIDTVEQLAAVYGLEAWQMLVPTLEAHPGANGRPVVTGLPDWPFALVDRARYEALSPEQRGHVQANLLGLIKEAEKLLESPTKRRRPEHGRDAA
jgi:hypothetical protein